MHFFGLHPNYYLILPGSVTSIMIIPIYTVPSMIWRMLAQSVALRTFDIYVLMSCLTGFKGYNLKKLVPCSKIFE